MKTLFRRIRCYFFGHCWCEGQRYCENFSVEMLTYYCLDCAKHVFKYQKDFVRIRANEYCR